LFRSVVVLDPSLPFWKIIALVFLPAVFGTSNCLVFVPLINTVLLLGVLSADEHHEIPNREAAVTPVREEAVEGSQSGCGAPPEEAGKDP
jgi:hypothetical protein